MATTVGANYKRRCDEAADALRALVALPADRPGAWEAGYVEALDGQLHEVLSVLEGGDR